VVAVSLKKKVIPFAQAAGEKVIVMEVAASRLDFCQSRLNVEHVIDATSTDPLEVLSKLTASELPTAVFDATGNSKSMMNCFNYVAHSGRVVFVGLFPGDVSFDDPNFHRREMSLLASRNALPGDFRRIIGLVEAGVIDTTPWITHRTPADQFVDCIPDWLLPGAGVIKGMISFT